MAQRGIREAEAKQLILDHIDFPLVHDMVLVRPHSDISALAKDYPFLSGQLVAKPDVLVGKRGKHNLVLLNKNFQECLEWIEKKRSAPVRVGPVKGDLTHFLIEPFIPHDQEFYLAIQAERDGDVIYVSDQGGIHVEEKWDQVKEIRVPVDQFLREEEVLAVLDQPLLARFAAALHKVFADLDFVYLEINPIVIVNERIHMLDLVAKLDDTAAFRNREKWGGVVFPSPFGTVLTAEERYINELDSKTGASLKLKILNPEGRIWTMVAGGGASVVYADTIVDLGYGSELANYGEYSGDPNQELTYEYAKTVLDLMTRKKGKPKILIIGGGIANFTDVAKTFTGIIMALKDYREKLIENRATIYVRRGGPNYKEGLEKMEETGKVLGVPVHVYGPETHMTKIISLALGGKSQ
ncbi:MAG: ATPase [Desulfuromonadaceae bacterium]|nr:ATPase [Desulfuromonadaceae bacterium]